MALCNYSPSSSTNASYIHGHSLSSIFQIYCIFFLLLLPVSNSMSFKFSHFKVNDYRINFDGDSFSSNKVLELTKNDVNGHLNGSVGRATFSKPMLLWEKKTRWLADFSTNFSFEIKAANLSLAGDGLSFFLAPFESKVPPHSSGGCLGLFSEETALNNSTTNQIVAVEIDTSHNSWDPDSDNHPDHLGININSVRSVQHMKLPSSIKNGSRANASIKYVAATNTLSVYLTSDDGNIVFDGGNGIIKVVDLREYLPELVSVGFSASTGAYFETHSIISWDFSSTDPATGNSTTLPIGINNSTTPPIANSPTLVTNEGKKKSNIGLVVGLVVGLGVLSSVLGFVLFIWLIKRKSSSKEEDDMIFVAPMDDFENGTRPQSLTPVDLDFEKGTWPKSFTYSELVQATGNFDERGKLGEGGFGSVYKGYLTDLELNIAVKRISSGSKQGRKEYMSEVNVIRQLRHKNLVQLIGWCHEQKEFLLVYEFMANRSLDFHLYRLKKILTWEVRYKIALGLASALRYLHEEWEQCVVHRDIKSSNVMLDSNFNAKLGDFGLARLVDHGLASQTTVIAGTAGYLAPECHLTGKASKESDVFSFGIVALEIACGRRPVEQNKVDLVEWVWDLYGRGKLIEAADERLNKVFDEPQLERLMVTGLWCAHPDAAARPSIGQVLNVLNLNLHLQTYHLSCRHRCMFPQLCISASLLPDHLVVIQVPMQTAASVHVAVAPTLCPS